MDKEVFSKVFPTSTVVIDPYLPKIDEAYREIFKKALALKEEASLYFRLNHNAYDKLKGLGSTALNSKLTENRKEFGRTYYEPYKLAVGDFIQNKLFKTYGAVWAFYFKDRQVKRLGEEIKSIRDRYDISNLKV